MYELKIPLPRNETKFENAFAKLADRVLEIDIPTRTLFNAWECPVEFLPLLAWSLSVDVWDDSWSEIRKRQVIDAAPEVHRKKGTVAAVEAALASFDIGYELAEWWQVEPMERNGTFHINFYFEDASDYNSLSLREQVNCPSLGLSPRL